MDVLELRIGNFVTIHNDVWDDLINEIMKVSKIAIEADDLFPHSKGNVEVISQKDLNVYNQFDEYIKPIPLTEEWLLGFGFKNLDTLISGCIVYEKSNWRVAVKVKPEKEDTYSLWHEQVSPPSWTLSKFNSVHQLQNIYFALTGTELYIKERGEKI